MAETANKVVFLDRDGTINIDHGYVHKIEDFDFCPGALAAIYALRVLGFKLALVTNQSGIARGMFTEQDVTTVHRHLQQILHDNWKIPIAIACCPHSPSDHCTCRKPAPGLTKEIEARIGPIDYANSWMIGDKLTDAEFGKRIGATPLLIRSRYWKTPPKDVTVVDSLLEATRVIRKRLQQPDNTAPHVVAGTPQQPADAEKVRALHATLRDVAHTVKQLADHICNTPHTCNDRNA
jgi:D-glycero-D-manno-heptose 1,7-bisphosphate phosphatase